MDSSDQFEMQEPSIETDKLNYEIFSILESKFLFGYDDQELWFPKQIPDVDFQQPPAIAAAAVDSVSAVKNQRGKNAVSAIRLWGSWEP